MYEICFNRSFYIDTIIVIFYLFNFVFRWFDGSDNMFLNNPKDAQYAPPYMLANRDRFASILYHPDQFPKRVTKLNTSVIQLNASNIKEILNTQSVLAAEVENNGLEPHEVTDIKVA